MPSGLADAHQCLNQQLDRLEDISHAGCNLPTFSTHPFWLEEQRYAGFRSHVGSVRPIKLDDICWSLTGEKMRSMHVNTSHVEWSQPSLWLAFGSFPTVGNGTGGEIIQRYTLVFYGQNLKGCTSDNCIEKRRQSNSVHSIQMENMSSQYLFLLYMYEITLISIVDT